MAGEFEREIHRFPEFMDRLRDDGGLDVWDAVDSQTEIEGLVYHHRGVQVPSYTAAFAWEEAEYGVSAFTVNLGAVGPRDAWAAFDATKPWDVYLVLFDGGAAVAWMTDDEFQAEEAERFPSKPAAVKAGSFSFGVFFRFGPDWTEREQWAHDSTAPAMLQLGDGRVLSPETETEFYSVPEAIPVEFLPTTDDTPPGYLGLLDAELSTPVSLDPH